MPNAPAPNAPPPAGAAAEARGWRRGPAAWFADRRAATERAVAFATGLDRDFGGSTFTFRTVAGPA